MKITTRSGKIHFESLWCIPAIQQLVSRKDGSVTTANDRDRVPESLTAHVGPKGFLMKRHFLYSWLFIVAASLLSACGSSNSSSSTTSYIRLVNATQVAGLTLTVTDNATISNIGVGAASGYTSLAAASYSVIVSAPNGSLATSSTATVTLGAAVEYTVVAYARGGQIKLLTITDSQTAPSSGFASVTAINAGQDAGTLDVYMVSPGSSITNLTATFSSVAASSTSLTQLVTAGTYDIIVTGYSNPSDLRLTIPSVALTSGEIVSVVLTSTTGGGAVNSGLSMLSRTPAPSRPGISKSRTMTAY